jgi:hypothetical protein
MARGGKNKALIEEIADFDLIGLLVVMERDCGAKKKNTMIRLRKLVESLGWIVEEQGTWSTFTTMVEAGAIPLLVHSLGYDWDDNTGCRIVKMPYMLSKESESTPPASEMKSWRHRRLCAT